MPTTAQQLLCACTSGDVRLHNSRCACVFQLLYDKKRSSSQCRENDLLYLFSVLYPFHNPWRLQYSRAVTSLASAFVMKMASGFSPGFNS